MHGASLAKRWVSGTAKMFISTLSNPPVIGFLDADGGTNASRVISRCIAYSDEGSARV
jgi:hypothetical protein